MARFTGASAQANQPCTLVSLTSRPALGQGGCTMGSLDIARMLVATFVATAALAVLGRSDEGQVVETVLRSAELEQIRTVPLPDDEVFVRGRGPSEAKGIKVAATETEYRFTTLHVKQGAATQQWPADRCCFELRSLDPNTAYSWCIWWYDPLWNARLFTDRQAHSYVAWVYTSAVCIAEVGEPNDKVVELTKTLSTRPDAGVVIVPVSTLLREVLTWGRNALHADIRITSLKKDDKGTFELKSPTPRASSRTPLWAKATNGAWPSRKPRRNPRRRSLGRSRRRPQRRRLHLSQRKNRPSNALRQSERAGRGRKRTGLSLALPGHGGDVAARSAPPYNRPLAAHEGPGVDHQRRIADFRDRLERTGLDAYLLTSPPNVRYLCGFTGEDSTLLIAPARSVLVTDSRYQEQAKREACVDEVISRHTPMAQAVAGACKAFGVRRLGVTAANLTHAEYLAVAAAAGTVEVVSRPAGIAEQMRMRKDADEVEAIRASLRTAEAAFREVLKVVEPGRTERWLAARLEYRCGRAGPTELPSRQSAPPAPMRACRTPSPARGR